MSLHSVVAVLILTADAAAEHPRIFAKYYSAPHHSATSGISTPTQPYPHLKEQRIFEKGLLEKTAKQNSDVILYDNKVVVFKHEQDVMLYVVGGADENEILLYNVVLALRDSLSILLKYEYHGNIEGRTNITRVGTRPTSAQSSRITTWLLWRLMRSLTMASFWRPTQ